jgi:hypothetical protein
MYLRDILRDTNRINSRIARWMVPFEYHTTTTPRKDATIGAVHPSKTKWMVGLRV